MNEDLLKAFQSAEFLCDELREAHKKLCKDSPTIIDALAERHVLSLLESATQLRKELGALQGFRNVGFSDGREHRSETQKPL